MIAAIEPTVCRRDSKCCMKSPNAECLRLARVQMSKTSAFGEAPYDLMEGTDINEEFSN